MNETHPKWYEFAEKSLDHGDEIQKIYVGKIDGERGYLCLSNMKLLFVHEEGFLRKTYDVTIDLPYEKIGKISREGRYELNLVEVEGQKHDFKTVEPPVSVIEKSLKDLMKSAHA